MQPGKPPDASVLAEPSSDITKHSMKLNRMTISACLDKTVQQAPDKTALVYEDTSYTWQELERYSDYMAYRMFSMGIGKGSHVGIWSVNTPNWVIVFLALSKMGALPVLINTCYQEKELADVLEYADVEYLYYGEGYKNIVYSDVIEKVRVSQNRIKKYIYIGKDKYGGWINENSFVYNEKTLQATHLVRCLEKESTAMDEAAMLFTSGTTSQPKGVLLTHLNLINTAQSTIRYMQWHSDEKICITVPLFHCFGLTSSMLTTILLGSTMYILPYFRTAHVLECVQKHGCTAINGVPSMFLALVKNPQFAEYRISSLKSGIIAGSPLSVEDYLMLSDKMPHIVLITSYGQTETSPAVSFARFEDSAGKRGSSAGQVIDGVRVRIVDFENRRVLSGGGEGEIQVKGYNTMKGYYKLPAETAQVLSRAGWLSTGDLGCLDQDGYLYIKGRRKEIIIRAGENISPREIESRIMEIPWVEQVVVLGVPAEVIQEKVVACIIPKDGEHVDAASVQRYLESRVSHYKIPEEILEFQEFPVSASGKIQLGKLKAEAVRRLERDCQEGGRK